MAATISFNGFDNAFNLNNMAGSGLGFYGSGGYGTSVPVAGYQSSTYITDSQGTATNPVLINNIQWVDQASGIVNGTGPFALRNIPNYLSTLNIRLTNSTPVVCTNPQLFAYDRVNVNNAPTGCLVKTFINAHTGNSPTPAGSGSTTWYNIAGSGSVMNFSDVTCCVSPGMSGLCPSGINTSDTTHDWYCGVSLTPTSVGSKYAALFFQCEFV